MDEKKYIENIPMWAKKKASLPDIRKNMDLLHIKLPKIVHVAGTNGKGSVCAYLSNILMANKKKVATFISPHLVEINERILLNMKAISDKDLCEISEFVRNTLNKRKEGIFPTYFEYIFYIAGVYFTRCEPDYVILETGMGGRLDVTNVFEDTFVSIITSIGMDHMQYLGNSIEEIAFEKAGIIKPNSRVVFDDSDENVNKIICDKAGNLNSKLIPLSSAEGIKFDFLNADYKVKAAKLAVLAAELLLPRVDNIDLALKTTYWHGRMEEIKDDIILDGAHNEPAIAEFVKNALRMSRVRKKSIKILISIVRDKEYDTIFNILTKVLDVKKYYLTLLDSSRSGSMEDLRYSLISNLKKNKKDSPISCFDNAKTAFSLAENEKQDDEILFCIGSLYLIGEILEENI